MQDKPIMIDLKDVKKKYLIRHNFEKPKSFSGKLKLAAKRILHPTKKYNNEEFMALDGISFQVRQGEKIGIIGKNGAGKSTLLKVLSRITEPSDGRIEMIGKVSAMLEVGTGFNMELTGRENIYLNGAILGMTKAEIDEKFDDIVAFSEVGRFIDTPVKRYSSGMYVRLAFAVASHLEPDILIVDEVLSVGDTRFQRKCIDRMLNIAKSGRTILYVSHQMQTIRQLCDRVIVLKEGKIIYDGDVEKGIEIYNESADVSKTKVDLKERKKRGTQMAVIDSCEIVDKENCAWVYNEPIKLRVKIKANEDCEDVFFLFVIRDIDAITPYGKGETAKLCSFKKGEEYEFEFEILTQNLLAPGKYTAGMELWKRDDGIVIIHDIVPAVFDFEIVEEDENDPSVESVFWNGNAHGYMMLPEIKAKKLS